NQYYDEAVVPANLNDLFYRRGGGGASYSIFLYNNGILLNTFFGGTGGINGTPSFITTMPALQIDMMGTATDFSIDFANYSGIRYESVIQDAGSDNGFMRTRDGFCGEWTKSSANVFHTPKTTNGSQNGTTGEINVDHALVTGNPTAGSIINYDVVSAPADAFPVEVQIYLDNGSIPGELDADDVFIEANTEYSVNDGGFITQFQPFDNEILMVVNSAVGCIDRIYHVINSGIPTSTLPVKLIVFEGTKKENNAILQWTVSENEAGKQFIIEKSVDGKIFTALNTVNAYNKIGTVHYQFIDPVYLQSINHYKIKLINKDHSVSYSQTVIVKNEEKTSKNGIQLLKNPILDFLEFTHTASSNALVNFTIYNLSGARIYSKVMQIMKGANIIRLPLESRILPGMYIIESNSGRLKSSSRFLKQ
ncbi:MAG: T9SS type A sorting domain-containing protein, partial [Chitinophagaceae bacterium]